MVKIAPRQLLPRAVAYVLVWTFLGLFFSSREILRRTYWNEPFHWQNVFTTWLVGEYLWGAVALIVLAMGNRWPLDRPVIGKRLILHAALSGVVASIQLALEALTYLQLGTLSPAVSHSFWSAWPALLVIGFHGNVVLYWVILGLQTGYRHYQKLEERDRQALRLELDASELRTQLMRAQLSALKMQLQPHFLFNTLNAIVVLVREQSAARAEEMLARLGDLLRCVLDEGEAQEVPLCRELEYVRLYLSIEQVRFDDRLTVAIDTDPAVLDAAVPHMALQPIVENAVRHGTARSSAAGSILITATLRHGVVTIAVTDDAASGATAASGEGWGIGLGNTRARLSKLHGEQASLTLQHGSRGSTVTMTLPYRRAEVMAPSETARASSLIMFGEAGEAPL